MTEEIKLVLIGIRELGMNLSVGWWILCPLSPQVMHITRTRVVVVNQDSLRGWWWLLRS